MAVSSRPVVSPHPHELVAVSLGGELAEIAEVLDTLPLFGAVLAQHRQTELGGLDAQTHPRRLRAQNAGKAAGRDPVEVLTGRAGQPLHHAAFLQLPRDRAHRGLAHRQRIRQLGQRLPRRIADQ